MYKAPARCPPASTIAKYVQMNGHWSMYSPVPDLPAQLTQVRERALNHGLKAAFDVRAGSPRAPVMAQEPPALFIVLGSASDVIASRQDPDEPASLLRREVALQARRIHALPSRRV